MPCFGAFISNAAYAEPSASMLPYLVIISTSLSKQSPLASMTAHAHQPVRCTNSYVQVDDKWRPLDPGTTRPVHWPDGSAPLRLALRIYEPGWSWSGSVDVGKGEPGDLFVKVRYAYV